MVMVHAYTVQRLDRFEGIARMLNCQPKVEASLCVEPSQADFEVGLRREVQRTGRDRIRHRAPVV
jgi:hypothetical protein